MTVFVRSMKATDWPAVQTIYEEGIRTGVATFATIETIPDYTEWNTSHLIAGRLVAIEGDRIVGWSAFSPVASRSVYSGVVEISIYTAENYRGKGVGNQLMAAAIKVSETNDIWTIQAGIFPENQSSIRLHEKHGFRVVGQREKIGKTGSIWKDTLLLERRSEIVGIN